MDNFENVLRRPTCTVEQAAQILGLSRNGAYEAIRRGELPALRFGKRRIVIPTAALRKLLQFEAV